MVKFNDYLYKYGLHDTIVNDISMDNNKLIFCFNDGVYQLDELGKETTLTSKCKMTISIDALYTTSICQHIEIIQIVKRRIKEITYEDLVKQVNKSKLDVHFHFYSYFANTILIEAYLETALVLIKITEVNNINFSFQEKGKSINN